MKQGPLSFLSDLIHRYSVLEPVKESILAAFELLVRCYKQGGKLLVFGNGGSAADADHIVGELMKGFLKKRPLPEELKKELRSRDEDLGSLLGDKLQGALPAVALTNHSALYSAFCNDVDPDMVFAQQVQGLGKAGDVALGLSTSGNSRNVVLGLLTAKVCGLSTIGLTGEDGGQMKKYCDVVIKVPSRQTPLIQELHLPIYHTLCAMVEDYFFEA